MSEDSQNKAAVAQYAEPGQNRVNVCVAITITKLVAFAVFCAVYVMAESLVGLRGFLGGVLLLLLWLIFENTTVKMDF